MTFCVKTFPAKRKVKVLNSLIQRCHQRPIKYYIAKVVDTLNGGVPFSSSLSTGHRLAQQSKPITTKRVTQQQPTSRLVTIGESIARWIMSTFPYYFRSDQEPYYNVKVIEDIVKINYPNVFYCQSR